MQAAGHAGAALDSIRWGSDYLLKVGGAWLWAACNGSVRDLVLATEFCLMVWCGRGGSSNQIPPRLISRRSLLQVHKALPESNTSLLVTRVRFVPAGSKRLWHPACSCDCPFDWRRMHLKLAHPLSPINFLLPPLPPHPRWATLTPRCCCGTDQRSRRCPGLPMPWTSPLGPQVGGRRMGCRAAAAISSC